MLQAFVVLGFCIGAAFSDEHCEDLGSTCADGSMPETDGDEATSLFQHAQMTASVATLEDPLINETDRLRREALCKRFTDDNDDVASLKGLSAVVINLASREDRWKGVSESLRQNAPCLPFKRLDAVNGNDDPPSPDEVTDTWNTENMASLVHVYYKMVLEMSAGERGCAASHIKAWRIAAERNRPLLILEDDAVILTNFADTLGDVLEQAPTGTWMVFLSNMDRGTPTAVAENLQAPFFVWTTVGYMIWPEGARHLLQMLPVDMPVDNYLAWHINQGRIRAFSVRTTAVDQAAGWDVLSDVPHSDDVAHPLGVASNV